MPPLLLQFELSHQKEESDALIDDMARELENKNDELVQLAKMAHVGSPLR